MKKLIPIAAIALVLAGCRREDVRTFSVEVENLSETNAAQVVEAFKISDKADPRKFRYCDGVDIRSLVCDLAAKKVKVSYDSMRIARTNIRMLLEAKGFKVKYPENATGVAGYLNARPDSE